MESLGVVLPIISLCFFIGALVGDGIFGLFCFLVCFAMPIALCWMIIIYYVLFLFGLSMSSRSSSAINLFFNSS